MKRSGILLSMFVLVVGLLSSFMIYMSLPEDFIDMYMNVLKVGDQATLLELQEKIMSKGVIWVMSLIQTLLYVIAAAVAYQADKEDRKIAVTDFLFLNVPVLKLIMLVLIFMFAFIIGWSMFIIPGIFVAIKFGQCFYVMIDRPTTGVMEALGKSWYMTRGNFWKLFGFACLCVLLMIVGYFFFLIGLFFSMAFCIFASIDVFKQLRIDN